jgi:hypothetical protein
MVLHTRLISEKQEILESAFAYFHCLEIPFFPENFYEMTTYTNILTSESIFLVQYKASVF